MTLRLKCPAPNHSSPVPTQVHYEASFEPFMTRFELPMRFGVEMGCVMLDDLRTRWTRKTVETWVSDGFERVFNT